MNKNTGRIIALLIAFIGGILYRLGGIGKPFNTKVRDFGVPVCVILVLGILYQWHWSMVPVFFLTFAATTTYFGFVNPWFNKKTEDKYWWNWVLVGLAFSLALLPYVIWNPYHSWPGFFLRSAVCTVGVTLWSEFIGKDTWEEWGRGFIIVASLLLL